MNDAPRLNWALLTAYDPHRAAKAPSDLARMWQLATESLGLVVRPIEKFELAGTLNNHPGHVRSDEAKKHFPEVFALAVSAMTAKEPLRTPSRVTAVSALLSWARVYRPSGNPVDEWFFVPLLQSIDLLAGSLTPQEESILLPWAREFATSGDRLYAARPQKSSSRINNWMSRRLLIRSVATTVAGDRTGRAEMPELLREFVDRNYVTAPDGRRDGRTFDFLQRDALHYHVAVVHPLVEMSLCTPDLIDPPTRAAIGSGLEFLRPYFLGHKQHAEFARTTISFDRERRDAGNPAFRDAPWDPDHGRVLLRVARATFPEVRSWTEQIVDPKYDPRTKLLAAIHGEPQRRAEWS